MSMTLVISQGYLPIGTVTVQRAVQLYVDGKAEIERAHPTRRFRSMKLVVPAPRVLRLRADVKLPARLFGAAPLGGSNQNLFDRDYSAKIPAATKQVKVRVVGGDWLTLSEIGLKPPGASREDTVACETAYGKKPEPFRYDPASAPSPFSGLPTHDRQWLWKNNIEPWKELEAKGVGIFVGEWGSFNKTPHDVFLRWAEDNLDNWKRAEMGWAMWNFRGAFGVLDSGRADVKYEPFEGHKLDRKLLNLLQRY